MNPLVSIAAAIVRAEASTSRLHNAHLHSLHVVGSAGRASQLASAKKADITVAELREALAFVVELIEAGNAWCDLMPGLAGGPEFDRLTAALANFGAAS